MPRQEWLVARVEKGGRVVAPKVEGVRRFVEAELFQRQWNIAQRAGVFAGIEDRECHAAVGKRTRPDLDRTLRVAALGLMARGVLIDGDDSFVHQDGANFR